MPRKTKAEKEAEYKIKEEELNRDFESNRYCRLLNVLSIMSKYPKIFSSYDIFRSPYLENNDDSYDACMGYFIRFFRKDEVVLRGYNDNMLKMTYNLMERETFELFETFVRTCAEEEEERIKKQIEEDKRKENAISRLKQNFTPEELKLIGVNL